MILNPILAGGRKIKNIIAAPDYVQINRYDDSTGNIVLNVAYDSAENLKNAILVITSTLGNPGGSLLFSIAVVPQEQRVVCATNGNTNPYPCTFKRISDTNFTLTIHPNWNAYAAEFLLTVFEM